MSLYGITKDQLDNWSRDYPARIIVDGQHVTLYTFGLSIYSKLGDIDQALLPLLKEAATSYRDKRGINKPGEPGSPSLQGERVPEHQGEFRSPLNIPPFGWSEIMASMAAVAGPWGLPLARR